MGNKSMLSRMNEGNIFEINTKEINGKPVFQISEACDCYYGEDLTADELRQLGQEIIALADQPLPPKPE